MPGVAVVAAFKPQKNCGLQERDGNDPWRPSRKGAGGKNTLTSLPSCTLISPCGRLPLEDLPEAREQGSPPRQSPCGSASLGTGQNEGPRVDVCVCVGWGVGGRCQQAGVHSTLVVYDPALSDQVAGGIHTFLEGACFSTNQES